MPGGADVQAPQSTFSRPGQSGKAPDSGGDRSITLVDTREQSEWAAGHITGAIHLGKGVIERDIEQAVPDANTVLVLYCGGGYRSALAAAALHAMGYAGAVSMDGGWRGWNDAGGSTQSA
jgi:rhodanese-related sulfurtransferase